MLTLKVEDLRTYYKIQRGYVKAVDGVSFGVEKGQALGLVGESGCGKTTIATSLIRVLASNAMIVGGHILFKDLDIVKLTEAELKEEVRWKGISLVFQGAMNAMNPVIKVSDQIIEAIQLHEPNVEKQEALERAGKLFQLVGIDPSRLEHYAFEFSGGMRQRAMIAMALSCNPEIMIADEPSTALDVIVQAQVLQLLRQLKERLNLSLIIISHDLSIIAETCERAAVMYGGKFAETGDIYAVFKNPLHPYTQGLLGAFPGVKAPKTRLISIPGSPPDLLNAPVGCKFAERCKFAMPICRDFDPDLIEVEKDHWVACHLHNKK
ncbi:MAG TPA: ABC transporter ATP-binding protein [Candidatus Acidoferrum sp.]|nr:ABC transporter ATP-binding protein [Candidatus Acidoferrum sp.]